MTHYREFGFIDAGGNAFIINGYFRNKDEEEDPRFILPKEVIERANVVYDITRDVLVKCRWARTASDDAISIFRGLFTTMQLPTKHIADYYAATPYGSRTHRSI